MKRILLILLLLPTFAANKANGQGWEWATGTKGNNNYGSFSTPDAYGNIYVTGETFTGMNFTSLIIPSIGYTRLYLSKFDSSGNLKWVKTNTGRNTTGPLYTQGLTTDLFGNVYLLGCYDSTISFDGNALTNSYLGLYPSPDVDYFFLAKFDTAGNNKWVKSIGDFPNANWSEGNCIRADCSGNIYLICNFSKNATIGNYTFLNSDTSQTAPDMIVAKFDSSANVIWARHLGSDSDDHFVDIAITATDIYITGTFFHSKLALGADTLINTSSSPGRATSFITKLDSSGNFIWAKTNGSGFYGSYLTGLAVNSSSEVFTSGLYGGNFSLGSIVMPYGYATNSFLSKYDISGNLLWAKAMAGQYVFSEGVTLDGCGNAWIMAQFGSDVVTSNDTIDGHIISPPVKNKYPLFISGWSSSGTYIGASVLASGGRASYKISTTTDVGNGLYVIGNNTLDTLKIASDTLYGNGGQTNMFLAKYNPNIICSPYSFPKCENPSRINLNPAFLEIDISPNPTTTEITITSTEKITKVSISNLLGQMVYNHAYNSKNVEVNVSDLPKGIYLVKVNGAEVRKLVKE